jgi:pimeloyl-ACP methyl ester carboxylesterase
MTAVNPMISLVTIADAGHLVHCEQPAAFLDAVTSFLE